jgi:diphthine-ammonia ligase
VENVCSRLKLTPLTYLWQRDRRELLDEIISSGVHAVLVKVAGAGLDPYKHLGKDLQTLRPTLERLHKKLGLDYCGEGERDDGYRVRVGAMLELG